MLTKFNQRCEGLLDGESVMMRRSRLLKELSDSETLMAVGIMVYGSSIGVYGSSGRFCIDACL